jgi:thiol-disulfide isomerase/thioredoxin
MMPLGTEAPSFQLFDVVSERTLSFDDLKSDNATVIMFICNHCPYVKHVQEELVKLAEDYIPEGIKFIAISSNDANNYPEDSPENMRIEAKKWGYPFPYLYDETQKTAKIYDAACTPDFFIFDNKLELIYRGQLDNSRPGNEKPLTGADIRTALDDYLKGNPITDNQIPSQGCNIKWKQ